MAAHLEPASNRVVHKRLVRRSLPQPLEMGLDSEEMRWALMIGRAFDDDCP
jgi:hypothetical protein